MRRPCVLAILLIVKKPMQPPVSSRRFAVRAYNQRRAHMTKSDRYMAQSLFDYGAATLAFAVLQTGQPVEELAATIAGEYAKAWPADPLAAEWIVAAGRILEVIQTFPEDERAHVMNACRGWTKKFTADGKRRRWRLFNGTRANSEPHNPARVQNTVRRVTSFILLAKAGAVPPEWLE